MLKRQYATREEIPEGKEDLYTEQGGVFVLTGVEGLKTTDDVVNLQEALRKERSDHKKVKLDLKAYSALGDPDEALAKLDRIDELESAAGDKIDENKINEMVETRMKTKTAPLERQIATLTSERDEAVARASKYEEQNTTRTVSDALREAAIAENVRPDAVDTVVTLGVSRFNLDGDTNTVIGAEDGIEPQQWVGTLKESHGFLWQQSAGAGGQGGGGSASFSKNPWSKKHWNMTEQGKLYKVDSAKAEQMAEAAGSSIGAHAAPME